ncbi:MAG TPA: hypothetical protein VMW53_07485 [archaeon]|nr:hypothetical protein [archaeon]
MARTAIPLYVTGQLVTSAHGNTYWRDNEAAHWAAIVAKGLVLIETKLLGAPAASFDFTAIPATYNHLKLMVDARGTTVAASEFLFLRFNNDSGNNYDHQNLYGIANAPGAAELFTQAAISIGNCAAGTAAAGLSGSAVVFIPNYKDTVFNKTLIANSTYKLGVGGGDMAAKFTGGFWRSAAAINRITIYPSANNYDTGSIASLYGLI